MSGYEDLKKLILGRADEVLDDEQRKEILHNRLAQLTRRQMKLLTLYYFESHSVRAIGKILGISKSHVSKQIRAIIQHLRISSDSDVRLKRGQKPRSKD